MRCVPHVQNSGCYVEQLTTTNAKVVVVTQEECTFDLSKRFATMILVITRDIVEGCFLIFRGSPPEREKEHYPSCCGKVSMGYHWNKTAWCNLFAWIAFINWYGRILYRKRYKRAPKSLKQLLWMDNYRVHKCALSTIQCARNFITGKFFLEKSLHCSQPVDRHVSVKVKTGIYKQFK